MRCPRWGRAARGWPAADLGTWAGHRLIDTLLGCAMALASMYLLWPTDKPDDAAVE
ncbi:hypothetical protein ACFPJ1_18305 [Kribbella qitaiheensis]|uniref:hypothetical protein n=1 Tax=Kribbella qitaiheensis TaxID=1544730 RepID=UPI003621BB5F